MKKVLAILVVGLFMIGNAAFAEEAAKPAAQPAASGEKSVPKTFFAEAKDLVTKQIPETPNQKSKTHRIWNQTPGRSGKPTGMKATPVVHGLGK